MLELKGLELKNVPLFKRVQISLEKAGNLVIVTGHNKDSNISQNQINAAGKSYLFSTIPNLVYQATPLSTKKNSKKDIVADKDSSVTMYFKSREELVKIRQEPKRYVIYKKEDSKFVDQEVRTDKLQRAELSRLWYLTKREMYSYVYVQTQRPLEFQIGTPSVRLDYITEIFNLDVYDRLRKHFNDKLSVIKDEEIRFQAIQTSLQKVLTVLAEINWKETDWAKLKKLRAKLKKVNARTETLLQSKVRLSTFVSDIERINSIDKELDRLRYDYPFDEDPVTVRKALSADYKTTQVYKRYESALKTYNKNINSIKKELSGLKVEDTKQELKALLKKEEKETQTTKQRISELKKELLACNKAATERKRISKELTELDVGEVLLRKDAESRLAVAQSELKLEDLLHCDDSNCPTCLQTVDKKVIRDIVVKARKQVAICKKIIKARKLHEQLKDLPQASAKKLEKELKTLKSSVIKSAKVVGKCREDIQNLDKIDYLKTKLKEQKKPKAPDIKLNYEYSEEEIEKYVDICHEVTKHLSAKERMYKTSSAYKQYSLKEVCEDPKNIKKVLTEFKQVLTALNNKTNEVLDLSRTLTNKVRALELNSEKFSVLQKQQLETEAQLETIRPLLNKRKVYEALIKAYSKKGLKVKAARSIIGLLEAKLNEYSDLIFFERHKFKLGINNQGITCIIHRANGRPSDVSLLSGSETNCFRLLFMVSMLSLVPKDRRTNFAILDESDSAMDEPTTHLFVNNFLPLLCEVVPHVFVITPKDPTIYTEADEFWTVTKQNGVSTLKRDRRI